MGILVFSRNSGRVCSVSIECCTVHGVSLEKDFQLHSQTLRSCATPEITSAVVSLIGELDSKR